jgi:DNA-binding CsgD family transcriptional regulator
MAKAMRARPESSRISVALVAARRVSATDAGERRADLLAAAVLGALETALDALQVPALIVTDSGEVICSNAPARTLLGDRPTALRWSPSGARAPRVAPPDWEVTPIRDASSRAWALMIKRSAGTPARRGWNLTARQREVLDLVARGMTNTSIAETLGIRLGTVEFHISAIFDKVGVNNRAALIASVMGG